MWKATILVKQKKCLHLWEHFSLDDPQNYARFNPVLGHILSPENNLHKHKPDVRITHVKCPRGEKARREIPADGVLGRAGVGISSQRFSVPLAFVESSRGCPLSICHSGIWPHCPPNLVCPRTWAEWFYCALQVYEGTGTQHPVTALILPPKSSNNPKSSISTTTKVTLSGLCCPSSFHSGDHVYMPP